MATTLWGLPQPAGTDSFATTDDSILALSNALDNATQNVTMLRKGIFADRPSAATAKSGCYYLATDTSVLYLSDGTNWVSVSPVDAAAGTASLRTLGTSATQAAAGNHSHLGYAQVAGSSLLDRILYGRVNSNGTRHSGSPGWTSARTPGGDPAGDYTITFGVTLYPNRGDFLGTPMTSGGTYNMTHNTSQSDHVKAYVRNTSTGALTDVPFSFILIGNLNA